MSLNRNAEPPPESLGKDSLTQIAYQKIKAAILHCELPPGSRFSEQQIASLLQVSRTPVHQAVVKLEQEGWLRFLPRKGVLISAVTAEEMQDIYEILTGLEALGIMRLASREPQAQDGIDEALDQARLEGERALARGDLEAWAEADDRLHTLFVDSSGNPHLSRLARNVREQAHRARLLTLRLRPRPDASNADHRIILDAIMARNPLAAREALESHRTKGMATLLPILRDLSVKARILG